MEWASRESGFYSWRWQRFSLHHYIQTCSGVHPASYLIDNEGLFSQVKAVQGIKFTIHLNIVPKVEKVWSCIITPPYTVKTWSLLKYRVNLHLTLVVI
jgi:hypothetical protein